MLKKLICSRFAWNRILGPRYNRGFQRPAAEMYRRAAEAIEIHAGFRVLDVSCGPAIDTLDLATRYPAAQFTGIDYAPKSIRFAQNLAAQRGASNVKFQVANAMDLPYPDAGFDIAYSMVSIKYWPDGVRGLCEIRRVIVPGATAIITEADRESPAEEVDEFAAAHSKSESWSRIMRWGFREIAYSRARAEQCAREAGFGEIKIEKMAGLPFFLMKLRKPT